VIAKIDKLNFFLPILANKFVEPKRIKGLCRELIPNVFSSPTEMDSQQVLLPPYRGPQPPRRLEDNTPDGI
jgi:hypothetical protein